MTAKQVEGYSPRSVTKLGSKFEEFRIPVNNLGAHSFGEVFRFWKNTFKRCTKEKDKLRGSDNH